MSSVTADLRQIPMRTRFLSLFVAVCAAALAASAPAIGVVPSGTAPRTTVVSLLGDRDGLGFGLAEGNTRSGGLFDNRGSGDPFFTDVYPVPGTYSPRLTVFSYEHQFVVPGGKNLLSASLNLFTLGIQDGDSQVFGGDTDIRVLLDGVPVPGALDAVDQFDSSPTGFVEIAGSVAINVPPALFRLFADGTVVVTFETHALGSHDGLDAYAIDFSQLTLRYQAPPPVPRYQASVNSTHPGAVRGRKWTYRGDTVRVAFRNAAARQNDRGRYQVCYTKNHALACRTRRMVGRSWDAWRLRIMPPWAGYVNGRYRRYVEFTWRVDRRVVARKRIFIWE
jgi:hypothetical protein